MEKLGQGEGWEAGKHQHISLCLALCWLFLVSGTRNWIIVPKVEGYGHFIHTRVCWTVAVTLVLEKNSLVAEPVCKGSFVGSWLGGVCMHRTGLCSAVLSPKVCLLSRLGMAGGWWLLSSSRWQGSRLTPSAPALPHRLSLPGPQAVHLQQLPLLLGWLGTTTQRCLLLC